MRTKVKADTPEATLARILATFERELIDATDVEIREAAQDLGMNLDMKGSAAFSGLRYPAKTNFSEFFGPNALERIQELVKAKRSELDDKSALPSGERRDEKK